MPEGEAVGQWKLKDDWLVQPDGQVFGKHFSNVVAASLYALLREKVSTRTKYEKKVEMECAWGIGD